MLPHEYLSVIITESRTNCRLGPPSLAPPSEGKPRLLLGVTSTIQEYPAPPAGRITHGSAKRHTRTQLPLSEIQLFAPDVQVKRTCHFPRIEVRPRDLPGRCHVALSSSLNLRRASGRKSVVDHVVFSKTTAMASSSFSPQRQELPVKSRSSESSSRDHQGACSRNPCMP